MEETKILTSEKRKGNAGEVKILSDELREQKSTNWLIGFILALGLLFFGFEFTQRETKEIEKDIIYDQMIEEVDEMIPVTQQEEYVAPPPQAVPQTPEIINEVEDEIEMIEEEEVPNTEETNQAIVATVVGTGTPTATVATGPVGPIVEHGGDDKIYETVEQNAEFPGGDDACMKWIQEHLKYPTICQEQGVQGRVTVQFVVNKDGSIVDVKILRSPAEELSKEAERVVKMMPKWKPARMNNTPVRSRFNLPIMFRLG